jgi:hypothetical protein
MNLSDIHIANFTRIFIVERGVSAKIMLTVSAINEKGTIPVCAKKI